MPWTPSRSDTWGLRSLLQRCQPVRDVADAVEAGVGEGNVEMPVLSRSERAARQAKRAVCCSQLFGNLGRRLGTEGMADMG
jgi:hypothetical protein